MKQSFTRLFFFLFLLCLTASTAHAQSLRSKMDQYMQAAAKVDHFMGSILVARHGKIILAKGYGMANIQRGIPNVPNTEFRIGSNTKQFTAMAILQLQAKGKLNVQNHICQYIPDCPKDWAPITIYELLTHTSGIPNFTNFPNYMQIQSHPITPTALLDDFKNKPLDFQPETRWSYSNSGYEVLGYIIERVSGESYKKFLQQNIFGPLGLKNTGYDRSHPTALIHAQGYNYTPAGYKQAQYVNMTVPFSAGALYSTVLDLYTWDQALHAGKLLPANLLQQMFAPQVPIAKDAKTYYGFGWFISHPFGRKEIWHEGGIQGFTSVNSWFPADDAYVIVLDNMTSPQVTTIAHSLAAILFGQKYSIPKTRTAIHLPPAALQKFVGQYQLAPNFILTIRRNGDQLESQATGQSSFPIYPASKTEFFLKVVNAQITFVENAKGDVTSLVLHQNGRNMPAPKISSTPPALPTAIILPPSALKKYTGQYQLAPGFILTITLTGDQLQAQATNQPSLPIYPKSKTEFFYKAVEAQITFVENSTGQVTSLVLHQGGRNLPAKKIK